MANTDTADRATLVAELRAAATTASMTDTGKTRNVHLLDSDLPDLIPSQSLLKVRSVKFTNLRMGDIICVRVGSSFQVRRFVKTKITRSHTLLLTAKGNSDKKEPIPQSALLGKVESVEYGGRTFDPTKSENLLKKFWGKLTEYGTHRPFGLIGAS